MAKQDSFTSDEWTLLRLAPSLVAGATAAADPSGIFASIKEAAAGAGVVAEAFKTNSGLELFAALATDHSIPGVPDPKTLLGEGSREQQLENFKNGVLVTTDSRKTKASPNLIHRDFTSAHPNVLWLSDITYIPTREGWLYLAAVLDAYSRALVGWAMSRTLDTKLAMDALHMAIAHRG